MIILHLFHTFNTNYDSESGTTYSENPAYGWVFAFPALSNVRRKIRSLPHFHLNGFPLPYSRRHRDNRLATHPQGFFP